MKSVFCLLACVAYVSATGIIGGVVHGIPDDGQWRPWLDNSILGASPGLATAALGAASVGHGVVGVGGIVGAHGVGLGLANGLGLGLGHGLGLGLGHGLGLGLGAGHVIGKRSLGALALGHGVINPNALNVPLDTVHVAAAKNAQLIQQAAEGTRNILGGGIPGPLPADTHAVAVGKVAHAIAHDTERAAVAARGAWVGGHGLGLGVGLGGLAGVHGLGLGAGLGGLGGLGWGAGLGRLGGVHGLGLGAGHVW